MAFDHRCRLIIDPPGEGAWNMAVDEALLESAQNDDVATLRFIPGVCRHCRWDIFNRMRIGGYTR